MNDFNKFLKIPNEDISNRTHILKEFIVYIKNKDYGKIKVRPYFHGFISSISDEYGFDLLFLLKEYDDFHGKEVIKDILKKDDVKIPIKENSIPLDTQNIEEDKLGSNNYFLIISIIFGIVFIMFWLIFKEDAKIEANDLIAKSKKMQKNKEEIKEVIKKENKILIEEEVKEENIFDLKKAKKIYKIKDNMLLLEPSGGNTIWLGINDLNNKKQVGNIIGGLSSYKIKPNSIILTGHGYLNFIDNNQNKSIKYRTPNKLFFYYRNGFLYQLKKEDALSLNGGFVW